MFKSFFFLNRLIIEFNSQLRDFRIIKAFSYEKDKLNLLLQKDDEEKILEISVNPGLPYINLKSRVSIPKKNLVDFFTDYLPLKINLFEIAENDRIIKINCDKGAFYFAVRGKYTNVFLINDDYSGSFKKTEEITSVSFREEVRKINFISEFRNLLIDIDNDDPDTIRKEYPVIGKGIISEALIRKELKEVNLKNILKEIFDEIKTGDAVIFIDQQSNEVNLAFENFRIFPYTTTKKFDSAAEALNHFLIEKFSKDNFVSKKKIIERHLERELTKISNKLNNIQSQIERGSNEEELNKKGNLLLMNINSIKKGEDKIQVEDIYNNNIPVTIKLDSKLSPKQNIDLYFEKARNEKIRLAKAKQLFAELNEEYSRLNKIKEKFLSADSQDELKLIMKELKIDNTEKIKGTDDIKNKFRHYVIYDKYNVYAGKDSKTNDLLTMKFAKQNDYWFHARSVSGSHVVLKNDNPKEGIPKNILKLVASIAAYHSKAKTSGMVPVSYTQKKYVSKRKGMEPGKVALLKEEVLIVRPEIPEGVKYEE